MMHEVIKGAMRCLQAKPLSKSKGTIYRETLAKGKFDESGQIVKLQLLKLKL